MEGTFGLVYPSIPISVKSGGGGGSLTSHRIGCHLRGGAGCHLRGGEGGHLRGVEEGHLRGGENLQI